MHFCCFGNLESPKMMIKLQEKTSNFQGLPMYQAELPTGTDETTGTV